MFSKDWTKNKCGTGKRVRDGPDAMTRCGSGKGHASIQAVSEGGREGRCIPSYADSLCILSAKQRGCWPPSDLAPVPNSSQGPLEIARSFGATVTKLV